MALAAYVPLPLLHTQLETPTPGRLSGTFWQGSILFADLSGFTARSGQLSLLGVQGAEELSALITTLFGALVAEVHAHGGSLLKFGGDALTAFLIQLPWVTGMRGMCRCIGDTAALELSSWLKRGV